MPRALLVRKDKKPGSKTKEWHSEKQKMEALILYLSLGNMSEVEGRLGIPVKTLYRWKYSDWWKEKLNELNSGNRTKLGTKVTNILSKASTDLLNRLEEGGYHYNPATKEIVRRPLQTKEIVEIMRVSIQANDSLVKAQEVFDSQAEQNKKADAALKRLEDIAKMLGGKPKPQIIDITPIEVKDAIQPELHTELQTREQVQVNPGPDPQAGVA